MDAEADQDTSTNAFTYYVAHRLQQLGSLDGKEITHSLRLCAARAFHVLEVRMLRPKTCSTC